MNNVFHIKNLLALQGFRRHTMLYHSCFHAISITFSIMRLIKYVLWAPSYNSHTTYAKLLNLYKWKSNPYYIFSTISVLSSVYYTTWLCIFIVAWPSVLYFLFFLAFTLAANTKPRVFYAVYCSTYKSRSIATTIGKVQHKCKKSLNVLLWFLYRKL